MPLRLRFSGVFPLKLCTVQIYLLTLFGFVIVLFIYFSTDTFFSTATLVVKGSQLITNFPTNSISNVELICMILRMEMVVWYVCRSMLYIKIMLRIKAGCVWICQIAEITLLTVYTSYCRDLNFVVTVQLTVDGSSWWYDDYAAECDVFVQFLFNSLTDLELLQIRPSAYGTFCLELLQCIICRLNAIPVAHPIVSIHQSKHFCIPPYFSNESEAHNGRD